MRCLALALLATGCMNITFQQAVHDPGPHGGSPVEIIGIGALGDLAIGALAAGAHAASSETLEFRDVAPFYILPLTAIDLVVTLIRIKAYKD